MGGDFIAVVYARVEQRTLNHHYSLNLRQIKYEIIRLFSAALTYFRIYYKNSSNWKT